MRNKLQDLACHKIQIGQGEELETVDKQRDVKKAFINENVKKFTQTRDTSLNKEPLSTILGEFGETTAVDQILEGKFTSPQDMDPLVSEFLEVLAWPENVKERMNHKNNGIETKMHVDGWKKQKEGISAEPSNLSFSHYKAAINNEVIVETDAMFRSLPFQFGFSPKEWEIITDVQILKKAGIYHVEKM